MITGTGFATTNLISPWTTPRMAGAGAAGDVAATSNDGVTLTSGTTGVAPQNSGEVTSGSTTNSGVLRKLGLGVVLAASLMGVTGCSTMNMDVRMVPNLQTQVTGAEAQSGFRSFTYLNQISTRDGGGLYDGKAKEDNRLTPMQALNRIMDGHEVNYVNKANDKPHPVRSWAELRGLESFVRQMQGEGGTTAVPQHQ